MLVKERIPLQVVSVLLFFLINVSVVSASNEILLKSRRFTPARGITAAAKAKIEAIPQRAHVLLQLNHIPTVKEREELEAKGIKLLSYIPNNGWFASVPSDKATEIAALPSVRAISETWPTRPKFILHSVYLKCYNI